MKRSWMIAVVVMAGGCLLSGCSSMSKSLTNMTDPIGNVSQVLAEKIADQGMLDQWKASADAHMNNPRAVAGVSVEVKTFYGLEGIDGDVGGAGGGDSTRLPDGVREALLKELDNPATTPERREAILTLLGWNRTASGGNPNAGGPGGG